MAEDDLIPYFELPDSILADGKHATAIRLRLVGIRNFNGQPILLFEAAEKNAVIERE
jgi:hypothetical protein